MLPCHSCALAQANNYAKNTLICGYFADNVVGVINFLFGKEMRLIRAGKQNPILCVNQNTQKTLGIIHELLVYGFAYFCVSAFPSPRLVLFTV